MADQAKSVVTLHVDFMCQGCSGAVTRILSKMEGVHLGDPA